MTLPFATFFQVPDTQCESHGFTCPDTHPRCLPRPARTPSPAFSAQGACGPAVSIVVALAALSLFSMEQLSGSHALEQELAVTKRALAQRNAALLALRTRCHEAGVSSSSIDTIVESAGTGLEGTEWARAHDGVGGKGDGGGEMTLQERISSWSTPFKWVVAILFGLFVFCSVGKK